MTDENETETTTDENETETTTTEDETQTTIFINETETTTPINETEITTPENDTDTTTPVNETETTTSENETETMTDENETETTTTENESDTTTLLNKTESTTIENETETTTNGNEIVNDTISCVTNNFEEDFDLSGATGICSRMRTDSFDRRHYSIIRIEIPHTSSTVYITPMQRLSCTATSPFTMHANGVLQVYVYLKTQSLRDQISVFVFKKLLTQDQIVGSFETDPRRHFGWNKFNITLAGNESYEGYVAFMGIASVGSIALIDSFRYIPPTVDESSCVVYEETPAVTSTTDTSDITSFTSTTELGEVEEDNGCVVYRFGQDFNGLFTSDGICRFSNNWELRNYSILKINSPHVESVSCIVPRTGSSCTSSFIFPVAATGVLEVKMYMEPILLSDNVEVIVHQMNEDGSISIVGSGKTSRHFGWTTIRIPLAGNGVYNGRVNIIGQTSARSFFVVDSFRYIPPFLGEQQCLFYSDENN